MFKNTFQTGFLSLLFSLGTKPLQIWEERCSDDGSIKIVPDEEIHSNVIEVSGSNLSKNSLTCPSDPKRTLGIRLPYLVLIIKSPRTKYFNFEIHTLDDKGSRRRFCFANYQEASKVKPYISVVPLRMEEGWNQVVINLQEVTSKAYGTTHTETQRVIIRPNVRIRRIYFSERLFSEEELPPEFRLYAPVKTK